MFYDESSFLVVGFSPFLPFFLPVWLLFSLPLPHFSAGLNVKISLFFCLSAGKMFSLPFFLTNLSFAPKYAILRRWKNQNVILIAKHSCHGKLVHVVLKNEYCR